MKAFDRGDVVEYVSQSNDIAGVIDDIDADTPPRSIKSIGVVGLGMMGGGIAMSFANHGYPVSAAEMSQEALDRGFGLIKSSYQRSVRRGRYTQEEADRRIARIRGKVSLDMLSDCDLIIEAVFEDLPLKKSIFSKLDAIAKSGAILATNTSFLDVNEIAAATKRSEDVLGMHYFSPANVMKLVEIVRAKRTSADVLATAMNIAAKTGKIGVLAGVCHGFVANRMSDVRSKAVTELLYRGLTPLRIDIAIEAFGFRMGVFRVMDLALDIGWKKGADTGRAIRDAICEQGRIGQKVGAGFFDYDDNHRHSASPVVDEIIRKVTGTTNNIDAEISDEEINNAWLYPVINEGVRILEESKVQCVSDIDVMWREGFGWPAHKGGPMYYGDIIGAATICDALERRSGKDPGLAPAALLRQVAGQGGKLLDIDTGGLKTA